MNMEIANWAFGAVNDHRTKEYVRWVQADSSKIPYLAVVDCYKYIGVKRVEVPTGPRIKKNVRGARTCSFWRENYAHSRTQIILGVPAINIRDLVGALTADKALSVAGGVERLCYFLLRNSPEMFLESCFVSPQKFETQRYI